MKKRYLLIGKYFQQQRLSRGFSQKYVAKQLKYSGAQFISNFERGVSLLPLRDISHLVDMYKIDAGIVIDLLIKIKKKQLTDKLVKKNKTNTTL